MRTRTRARVWAAFLLLRVLVIHILWFSCLWYCYSFRQWLILQFWYFTCIKFRIRLPLLRLFIHFVCSYIMCASEFVSFFIFAFIVFLCHKYTGVRAHTLHTGSRVFCSRYFASHFFVRVFVYFSLMFGFYLPMVLGLYVQFNALICIE